MGWQFDCVSSHGSAFNRDYHVSFTPEELAKGKVFYNFAMTDGGHDELPGVSVFYRNDAGDIFHTYSSYARGGDILIGTHHYLDLTPKGRHEGGTMDWMRRHDEYEDAPKAASCSDSTVNPPAGRCPATPPNAPP